MRGGERQISEYLQLLKAKTLFEIRDDEDCVRNYTVANLSFAISSNAFS